METVQLNFQLTEKEYIAAIRLYALHSTEILLRLIILWILVSAGLFLLTCVLGFCTAHLGSHCNDRPGWCVAYAGLLV